ncbi:P-loop containing nucleoside triphosphate hydrolase protein [Lactifluus subvellereus]|nr:P-loop containing nucleoside triphosphate hydrolase protein [Lactifluus subvellereus]
MPHQCVTPNLALSPRLALFVSHVTEGRLGYKKPGSLNRSLFPTAMASDHVLIIVMGVSGSGKTTLGAALAKALSSPFIDADDLHPQANKDKMSQGEPLTDADRAPWLMSVRRTAVKAAEEGKARGAWAGAVVACSALKVSYREVLRGERAELDLRDHPEGGTGGEAAAVSGGEEEGGADQKSAPPQPLPLHTSSSAPRTVTFFVHPVGPRAVLFERMTARGSHFMKANMLGSQLDTLEDPAVTGEAGIVQVGLEASLEEQVRAGLEGLRTVGAILL